MTVPTTRVATPRIRSWATAVLRAAAVLCAAILAVCCGKPADAAAGSGDAPCCEEQLAAAALPGTSVYQLTAPWRDQDGGSRHLAQFRGRYVVAAMMFTHCRYACPRILSDMRAIEAAIPAEQRDAVQFLLVSMDSERDTPEVLRAYADDNGIDSARWTLLHGAAGDVRELAAALGIRLKRAESGDFAHSNQITLLDPNGDIVYRQTGLGTAPGSLIARIATG